MNCLCLPQAKSNPTVIKILTIAALEQNHSVFTLDKECLEFAMDQLHSTSRSFVCNITINSISIWYLLLSFTTFFAKDRHEFDGSSTSFINLPVFRRVATGPQLPAHQHSSCSVPQSWYCLLRQIVPRLPHVLLWCGIFCLPQTQDGNCC